MTDKIVLKGIKRLSDYFRGEYIPYHGILNINIDRKKHFKDLQENIYNLLPEDIIDEIKKEKFGQSKLPLTLLHEQRHALHTTGTTIGTVFYLVSFFQLQIIDEIIPLQESKPLDNLKNSKCADKFRCIQKIGDFFLATNLRGHSKTLNDYISSVLWMSKEFYKIHKNYYAGKIKRELSFENLTKVLEGAAHTEIDINTHSIMEDYTKLCVYFVELGFCKIFKDTKLPYPQRISLCDTFLSSIIDVLDDLNDETSFTILNKRLGWIITKRGYAEFFYTCMAIYDLSLMTRFHPLLLFRKQELTIDELIIPFRFNRLIKFFNDNTSTIYDYCNPYTEQWKGFDKICRQLNWFTFSECMESIYDLYSFKSYRDTYYGILSRKVVKRRESLRTEMTEEEIMRRTKMGRKEDDKPYPVGNLPTLVFFDDLLIRFKEDGMLIDYGIEKRAILKKAIYDFISWTFFKELFCTEIHDGFKDTKRMLNKINPKQFDVKSFLKESGIGNYVQLTK